MTAAPADAAGPLRTEGDLDPLIERIGDARIVLLGEASHGTYEYYRWRDVLSRRLIAEGGFDIVAVEGDWPACFEVNLWVQGLAGDGRDVEDILGAFDRWPTWMWANREVAAFAGWLRSHNAGRAAEDRTGFYGFDVYSLWESMRAVVDYLEDHEPEAVETARRAFRCFEPYREDPQEYAWATRTVPTSCEQEVVDLLARICADAAREDDGSPELRFAAEQNAAVARNAERYYRAMIRGGPESWNVRDAHMVDTLDNLLAHRGAGSRAIVWAHNTHIGDARATDMAAAGMINVGQLVRERHGDDVVAVGFGGYAGSVIAADAWGAPLRRLPVPAARVGSIEDLLHREVGRDALFVFGRDAPADGWSARTMPHRAIGVVYHPERERWGNYVPTALDRRYDAFVYLDHTRALRPLGPEPPPGDEELETYPAGV